MMILAAIAGISAATAIYSLENVVDRKVCNKIEERKAEKAAAEAEAAFRENSQPVQPAAAPASAQQPTQSAREMELELQLAQMQAALAQATAPAPTAAPTAQAEIQAVQAEQIPESMFKVNQKVALSDTAQLIEGNLDDTDIRVGTVRKINPNGTVRVSINLGNRKGVRMVTLSEYDLCPAE